MNTRGRLAGFARSRWVAGAVAAALLTLGPFEPRSSAQRGGPPATAQARAPIDLTGYWASVITEDWRWRMMIPPKGDFGSVPPTAEAR